MDDEQRTRAYDTAATITGLARGVLDDARELFREEIALAKAEARLELSKAAAAGSKLGAAAVAGWFALMFALIAVAMGISVVLNWPLAAAFAIVAALLAAVAGGAFLSGRKTARGVQPLPRTVDSVKEIFR
jgi:preprotein translocase subunit SecF